MNLKEQISYDKLQKFNTRLHKWVDGSMKKTWAGVENTLNAAWIILVPPEALSVVAEYTAIKSTWLNENFPLDAWKSAGGLDPIAFEKVWDEDWSKPLVWVRGENWAQEYFCNPKWEELIAQIYGGYIEEIQVAWDIWTSPTQAQHDALKKEWKNNTEIIETLWLVKGWRHPNDGGQLGNRDNAVVRSRSIHGDDYFGSWYVHENESDSRIRKDTIWVRMGLSPRVFLNRKAK